MTIGRLAPVYRGRVLLPVLGKVTSSGYTDRVAVRLVSGQSAADFATRADNLAHGFGAVLCRVRSARAGGLVLEFVRRDALALIVPALPIPTRADLRALPAGSREDGQPWLIRAHGTHVLIAGATGAGKASLLWSIVRAMLPAMTAGLVRVWAADPKLMELAYGRAIFDRYGRYAADPEAIVAMLEDAVAAMQDRAAKFAGKHRDHGPTAEHPFVVIVVDEVAFLTAYLPDRQLRDRVKAALATLTTQGRAVGFCVIAALQDPRKEVMSIRNLLPDRIAMRLDEPEQVDMVLGDGARDRGVMVKGNKPGHRRFGNVRRLPSGRYQASYLGPYGQRRYAPETYARKSDAERFLTLVEAQLYQGDRTDPDQGRVTLHDYAVTWIEQRPGLRPRTIDLYSWLLTQHIDPDLGAVALGKLSTAMIREWRADLLRAGVSVSVSAKAYRFLRAVLMTAVEDDKISSRNPCRIRGAGDEKTSERPVLTVAQVFALAEQLGHRPFGNIRRLPAGGYRLRFRRHGEIRTSPEVYATRLDAERALWLMASKGQADSQHDRRYRALVLLAAFASLRWGEAAALRRCDLDLSAGTVHVRAAFIERSTGPLILGPPKSKAGRRTVGIPKSITPILRDHLSVYVAPDPATLLFTGSRAARCGAATSISSPAGRTLRGPSAPTAFTFTTCATPGTTRRQPAAPDCETSWPGWGTTASGRP